MRSGDRHELRRQPLAEGIQGEGAATPLGKHGNQRKKAPQRLLSDVPFACPHRHSYSQRSTGSVGLGDEGTDPTSNAERAG